MAALEPAFSLQAFPSSVARERVRGVTSAAASERFVLLGYADGGAALFDVFGHELHAQPARHAGSGGVCAAALGGGAGGDDVAATAARDGTVRAARLLDPAVGSVSLAARGGLRTKAAVGVCAVAVDPEFGKGRAGERVAYAMDDGKVVLYQAGWFGGETVVAQPDGAVHEMVWRGALLAWATPLGVRVYDTRLSCAVCFVESPMPVLREAPLGEGVAEDAAGVGSAAKGAAAVSGAASLDVSDIESARSAAASQAGSAVDAHGAAAAGLDRVVQGPSHWELGTSLLFDEDEGEPLSKHGERSMTLYVSWPSAAKVVVIGPHIDEADRAKEEGATDAGAADGKGGDAKDAGAQGEEAAKRPPRDVVTKMSVTRAALSVDTSQGDGSDALVSPLLAIAPFGDHVALLVGTVSHGVVLVRVDMEGGDVRCVQLPHGSVKAAQLCPIRGGDPFLLVVVKKDFWLDSDALDDTSIMTRSLDTSASLVDLQSSAESIAKISEAAETELVVPRTESTGMEDDSAMKDGSCVLFARTLSVPERIKWLLDHGNFAEAVKLAEEAPRGSLRRADVSISDVGDQFLESIRASGDYERLADVLPRIIVSTSPRIAVRGRDRVMQVRRERWEKWIGVFKDAGSLGVLARHIPSFEPRMLDETYNSTIILLADVDPLAMLDVLKTWPADVYDVPLVTRAVEAKASILGDQPTRDEDAVRSRDAVREALFMLYALSGRHNETLNLLLREKSERVFSYVKAHDLYGAVRNTDAVRGLYVIDKHEATNLLLGAPGTLLPPKSVVPILKSIGNREWLCLYMYRIYKQDPERASPYHGILLELLVEHGPDGALYDFLRSSTHFSLDTALKLMGGRSGPPRTAPNTFGRERVYVLATMGDLSSAMHILLTELTDVHGAIEFASEHGDAALWDRLIEHARDDADTLAALLDSPAGGKVNPVRLIPLISADMDIPQLRDRLHRILVDAALERALREETAAALHFDARLLMSELDDAVACRTPAP